MTTFLGTSECTRYLTQVWKEWHITKGILLCIGISVSIPSFYIALTLKFTRTDGPYMISSFCVGAAGLMTTIYALLLFWIEYRKNSIRRVPIRRNRNRYQSNDYILYFNNSSQNQPQVYIQAPSTSRGLNQEPKSGESV